VLYCIFVSHILDSSAREVISAVTIITLETWLIERLERNESQNDDNHDTNSNQPRDVDFDIDMSCFRSISTSSSSSTSTSSLLSDWSLLSSLYHQSESGFALPGLSLLFILSHSLRQCHNPIPNANPSQCSTDNYDLPKDQMNNGTSNTCPLSNMDSHSFLYSGERRQWGRQIMRLEGGLGYLMGLSVSYAVDQVNRSIDSLFCLSMKTLALSPFHPCIFFYLSLNSSLFLSLSLSPSLSVLSPSFLPLQLVKARARSLLLEAMRISDYLRERLVCITISV
jgi:hypothetical protein